MADYRERTGIQAEPMKSLMKIYLKYVVSVVVIAFVFFFFQVMLTLYVGTKLNLNGGPAEGRKVYARELASVLENGDWTEEQIEGILAEAGAEFAMVLDQKGELFLRFHLPQELDRNYDAGEIASFSRWYLEDYPVTCWDMSGNLLVIGYPKGSYWKYSVVMTMDNLNKYMVMLAIGLLATAAFTLILIIGFGFRYFRKMKTVVCAINDLSQEKTVCLQETGTMGEIGQSLNRTSKILARQREKLQRRDEARTRWISAVSHDIRTPLSLIMGYGEILEQRLSLDRDSRKKAGIIKEQSLQIKELIEDLNLTSKLEYDMQPLRKEMVCLSALLREAVAEAVNRAEENGAMYPVQLEISQDLEGKFVQADSRLLLRAFRNLLNNAVNHNPEGCAVSVNAEIEEPKKRKGEQQTGWANLSFYNSGKGLPGEIEEFINSGTEPDSGTHIMGLRIVKQIILAHGGEIWARTNGIEIRLPICKE